MTFAMLWVMASILLLGALVLGACGMRARADWMTFCGFVWPAGCLVLGLGLWLAVIGGVEPQYWLWLPLPIGGVVLACSSLSAAAPSLDPAPRTSLFLRLVLAFAVVVFALHFAAAAAFPCLLGDEANLWAAKAKSLYLDWYRSEFVLAQTYTPHPDSPLLNPLLQAFVYAGNGEVVHIGNRWPIQLCALSLVFAVAAAVKRRAGCGVAALLVLPLVLEPEFRHMSSTAYADGMVGLGLVLLIDGFLREQESPHRSHRAMAAIGCAFALWSKNEASLYVALAVAGYVGAVVLGRVARPKISVAHLWLLLPLAVAVGQFAWNRWFSLHNDLFGKGGPEGSVPELFVAQFGDRALPVLLAAGELLLDPRRLHVVLVVPFVAALVAWRTVATRALLVPTFVIVTAVVVLHLIYIGSYLVLWFHLQTSHRRVLFQLVPAALVWTAALVREARANDLAA